MSKSNGYVPMPDSAFCNLCGAALGEEYHLFEQPNGGRRIVVCSRCAATAERCTVCGVPVGAAPPRLSDGRPICTVCRASAVDDPLAARAIYEQVVQIAIDRLGLRVRQHQGFGLYSRADMQRLQRTITSDVHGPVQQRHLLGAFLKLSQRREIVVETGLPRLLMVKVIAHEYGHAWQAENAPFQNDAHMREGFCEWVAYHALGALQATTAQEHQRTAAGFYGDALRQVLEIETRGGIPAVVHAMRAVLPAGLSVQSPISNLQSLFDR